MAQTPPRYCIQCHSPIAEGQRFCPNCGTVVSDASFHPTALSSGSNLQNSIPAPVGAYDQHYYSQTTEAPPLTPPPPPPVSFTQTAGSYTQYPSQTAYSPPSPPGSWSGLPPYAQPKKSSKTGLFIGIGVLLAFLLIAGLIGSALLRSKSNTVSTSSGSSGTTNSSSTPTVNGGQNSGTTPGTGGGSEQLNLKVTYASIDITITSVQQQDSFPDDNFPNQPGVVRVSISESNGTASDAFYIYTDVARLILPDGSTTIAPDNVQHYSPPSKSANQTNWIDFPVTSKVDLSKLVLRLGTQSENQIRIPLNSSADMSAYQPKTISLNTKVQYAGISWTVTNVVSSLSADGKQADAGKRFITVNLVASNSSSNDFFGYDYLRLRSGSTSSSPTLDSEQYEPSEVKSGTTNVTGRATFLMPQDSTSFTLVFLQTDQYSSVSTNFHVGFPS